MNQQDQPQHQQRQEIRTARQALETAQSPAAITEILQDVCGLLSDVEIAIFYPADLRSAVDVSRLLAKHALETQSPQLSDDQGQIALPLVVEDRALGVLLLHSAAPLTLADTALITSLAQTAAVTLSHLSWPARPEFFRQLVENANVGINVANRGGDIIYSNRAAAQLYGYKSPEDLLGVNSRDLYVNRQEQQAATELIIQTDRPEGWIGEVTQRHLNGKPLPVRLAVFALRDQDGQKTDTFGAIVQNLSDQQYLLWSLQQQARRLHAAAAVARATISQLDLASLLKQVASASQNLFNFEVVSIMLIEGDQLIAQVVWSPQGELDMGHFHLALDETSINGWVALHGQPILVGDVSPDERYHAHPAAPNTAAELCVPMRLGETILGTFDVQSATRDGFQPEDLETFQGIADQLAVAVDNARLFAAERTRVKQLAAVNEISRLLAAAHKLEDLWAAIHKQIVELFDLFAFYVMLYDQPTNMLSFAWLVENGKAITSEPPHALGGLSSLVVKSGAPLLINNLTEEWPGLRDTGIEPITIAALADRGIAQSWMGVPLRAQDGSILGVMSVQSYHINAFSLSDQQLLMTIATQVSLALENTRLFTQLEAAAAKLRARARRVESLYKIGTVLSSSLDRNQTLALATEQVVKLLEVDHCWVTLFNPNGKDGEFAAEYPDTRLLGTKFSLIDNPIYAQHMVDDVVYYPDVRTEPTLQPFNEMLEARNVRSMIIVRLAVKDKVIGSIGLDTFGRIREFSSGEIETCQTLALQLAFAVENSDLYAKALAANVLKSQFLATMSHELRTPLNSILGYTENVLSGLYGDVSPKQQDRLQRVYSNAQSLLELINDVLDLAKIESGRMVLTLEPVDVAPLITTAINNITPQAEAKQLTVTVQIDENLPPIMVDSTRLRQITINLLSNAVKFTHEGGITINVRRLTTTSATPQPSDVILPAGEWVLISVADSGIGIAPGNFQMIFDAFRQVDGSAVREYPGTGLGLSITRQLIEMHGGKIWLESHLKRGTTFTVALPVTPNAQILPA